MSESREPVRDDRHVVRYLLGCLTDDESERLDEHSIMDNIVAAQLRRVEDDLVDAYVSGTLDGELRERFESVYLASPRRRRKVAFAQTLMAVVDRQAETAPDEAPRVPTPGRGRIAAAAAGSLPAGRAVWQTWFRRLTAAALLLLCTGVLFLQDLQLRRGLKEAQRHTADADQRVQVLAGRLAAERAANTSMTEALARVRSAKPAAAVALVLVAQTRGVSRAPIIAVRPGSDAVPLDLLLEPAVFTRYQASLRDPALNRTLWRSQMLTPEPSRRPPTVSVAVPAALLKPQHYSVDLAGGRSADPLEIAASYVFQVVRQ